MQVASYVLDVSHSSAISSRTTYPCAEFYSHRILLS